MELSKGVHGNGKHKSPSIRDFDSPVQESRASEWIGSRASVDLAGLSPTPLDSPALPAEAVAGGQQHTFCLCQGDSYLCFQAHGTRFWLVKLVRIVSEIQSLEESASP